MSKGLKALERLERGYCVTRDERLYLCDTIKKDLKEGEKNKQALEIIKNANLNVVYYGYIDGKDVYALRIGEREIKYISQEEYDLLKEN